MNSQKKLSKREKRTYQRQALAKDGGLMQFTFTFGGKKHVQSHRLSQAEMDAQMAVLKQHGLAGMQDSSITRIAIWGARMLGQHSVEEAFKEFIRENWKPEVLEVTTQDVVEELAKRNGIVLSQQ